MNVRLTLSNPSVKELAKASCVHERHYDGLPKLQGETDWQQWSDALQHAALMAGTDAILNGESRHPPSLEEQSTTAEWNDNIRRTAVWRRRNESLLKAMRKASGPGVDLNEFGGLNAHDTYLGLRSKFNTSDNQMLQTLYEENLMLSTTELDDSPRDIADSLQSAFSQYNQLVGRNIEQRLPENFLKMEFLMSLDSAYGDWRKALLKEQHVLALNQESTLTFNELVDLVIAERARLLQEQMNGKISAPTASRRSAKRNISQVDEPAQPDLHRPRSSPHRDDHHSDDSCSDESENADDSESEVEDDVEEQIPASDQNNNRATTEVDWQDLVAARHADVKTQQGVVTAASRGFDTKRRRYRTLRGDLTGQWLLYNKKYNPGTGGHHHIQIWNASSEMQKRLHPNNHEYRGRLVIGPREKPKTLEITLFSPSHHVTGRRQPINFKQSSRKSCKGWMIFWGNGKMIVTAPVPIVGDPSGRVISMEFAGIQKRNAGHSSTPGAQPSPDSSDASSESGSEEDDGNDDQSGDDESSSDDSSDGEERYDRVIRTERRASVAIKAEEYENTAMVRDTEEVVTAVAIKAEQSDSDESADEHVDIVANTIDAVQKQEDLVNQGVIVPLYEISGKWHFHSPKYHPGLVGGISLSFSSLQDHDTSEQTCAPGHCKSTRRQACYCGELCLKVEEGKSDFDCLIKQFDVPEHTSPDSITILLWNRHNHDTICMHAWFFGNGTMRIELPTAMIPSYQGQDAWITFSGLKCGWPRGA